ncbi:DUF4159 domain-containing protein [bacterium]|nr:DUF4159 domain-containing protein [bacterium]
MAFAQDKPTVPFTVARLKYSGSGDWYANPSSLPNLLEYVGKNTGIPAVFTGKYIEPSDDDFFNYPYLYMTGHGDVRFSEHDVARMREYLTNGGFIHADDNYGMDKSLRREIKRIFPDKELVELPFDHEIYHCFFNFPQGLPKIHEHDGKPPQGFGIFHEGRLVLYYTYETDLGDGWEDSDVHNDPPEKREEALKMGTNIVVYTLTRL